jgi:hypothetical protein
METEGKKFNPEFTPEDLEKVKKLLEERIKTIEIWREYALKKRRRSVLERLKRELQLLEEFKTFGDVKGYLEQLNRGEFKFLPGEVFFLLNPYFGKVRLTYKFPEPRDYSKVDRETALRFFLNKLAAKLTALKLKEFLKAKEHTEGRKLLQPGRVTVINRLVRTLKKLESGEKKFKILRGDFKDYTLNIPRKTLYKELERLEVPAHLVSLIKNFLSSGNRVSEKLKRYPIASFFRKRDYRDDYNADANFRSLLNEDGVVPGSPLSNLLGQIFLLDFDKMMEDIAGEDGFYARFLDDFVLIFPEDKITDEELKEKIISFIRKKYAEHPLVKTNPEGFPTEKIIKLDEIKTLPTDFDFLGYLFKPEKNRQRRTIRYKTLKKFLLKYLNEYKLKPDKNTTRDDLVKHLSAKSAYLYRWVYNFLQVNDKKLLDELFINFIYPDLFDTIFKYLKVKHPDLTTKELKTRTRMEVKKIKNYFKPTLIHRLLKKACAKVNTQGEECEKKLTELVKKVSKEIEERVTVK